MEKKSIGKFISILRRASGMTQKELADRLYVSDKTVSRWECEESTPDLSLLPAIAEIFSITTDELLRGERNNIQEQKTSRGRKQLETMLHSRMVRFRNCSMVSVGISLTAVIAALVINWSFYKAILAFGVGAVLMLAAVLCQIGFTTLLPQEEEYQEQIANTNSKMIRATAAILLAQVSLLACLLPLVIYGGGSYGVAPETMAWGLVYGGVTLAAGYGVYLFWIRRVLVTRGLLVDEAKAERKQTRKLFLRQLTIGCILAAILLAADLGIQIAGPDAYARETQFRSLEQFQTFAREGILRLREEEWGDPDVKLTFSPGGNMLYYDLDGDGVYDGYEKDSGIRNVELKDESGRVVGTYLDDGTFLDRVRCDTDSGTGALLIHAVTKSEGERSLEIMWKLRDLCYVLILAEFAGCALIFVVKNCRKKKDKKS